MTGVLNTTLRTASTALMAAPALNLGVRVLAEGVTDPEGMSLNSAFHVMLGIVLLVLFVEFAVVIWRSVDVLWAMVAGMGGFLVTLVGAFASELLGPPALLALVGVAAFFGVVLARRKARPPAEEL